MVVDARDAAEGVALAVESGWQGGAIDLSGANVSVHDLTATIARLGEVPLPPRARALAAGEDFEAFTACGGAAFLERLIDQIGALHEEIGETSQSLFETSGGHVPQAVGSTEADMPAEMPTPLDRAGFETIEPGAAEAPVAETPAQDSPAFGQTEPEADSADTVRVEKVESSMPVDKPDANPDTAPRIIPRRVRAIRR